MQMGRGGVARVPADTEVFWRWLFLPDGFSAGDRIEVLQTYPPVKACARMQHPCNLGWQKREPSGWSPKRLRVRGGCEPNNQGQLPADCLPFGFAVFGEAYGAGHGVALNGSFEVAG